MNRSNAQTPLLWAVALACFALFAAHVAREVRATSVWDDAWMFVRYAQQLLAHGVPAFAPGGPGTYGLTSPAFLSVVAPLALAFGGDVVRVALGSSLLAGALFLLFLSRLLVSLTRGAPRRRAATFALVAFTLAYGAPALARHFASGMDTTFALAYLTVWLLLAQASARLDSDDASLTLGLFGGAAFAVRPDLLVFTFGAPLVAMWCARHPREKRGWARAATFAALAAGAQSAAFAWWLHAPLPLPFFVKTAGFYGPTLRAAYAGVALAETGAFLRSMSALRIAIAAAIVLQPLRWWRESAALEKALLGAGLAFTAYHAVAVVPIMGYAGRFQMPLLPVLAFLAATSLARLARDFPAAWPRSLAVTLVALLVASVAVRRIAAHATVPSADGPGRFSLEAAYRANWADYWVGLDRVSALPDDLTLATTEVGLPAALAPGRRIVDLSGLNERSMALAHVSADSVVRREAPDLVYLPHPHYAEMRDAMLADPRFRAGYEIWTAAALRADMGVAVRRTSPYADTLRALFAARAARAQAPEAPQAP
ncbi:MAG: hypothetical protein U0704_14640 [Candidatus Eisenbacteria bacterium]